MARNKAAPPKRPAPFPKPRSLDHGTGLCTSEFREHIRTTRGFQKACLWLPAAVGASPAPPASISYLPASSAGGLGLCRAAAGSSEGSRAPAEHGSEAAAQPSARTEPRSHSRDAVLVLAVLLGVISTKASRAPQSGGTAGFGSLEAEHAGRRGRPAGPAPLHAAPGPELAQLRVPAQRNIK